MARGTPSAEPYRNGDPLAIPRPFALLRATGALRAEFFLHAHQVRENRHDIRAANAGEPAGHHRPLPEAPH